MAFVRGPNPIWFYANLVGQPVDDTYFAFFLTNTLPYVPQAVYQDPNGTIPWSDPIEFSPSSGLPNNLYFDPNLVYRIEIRQGPTQADPLIYLIENYVLESNSVEPEVDNLLTAENMITNPQFADVYFTSPHTISVAGTYDIAPGWQLVLQGAGSTTLTQFTNDGQSNVVGQPPYYVRFNNAGWTSAQLVQRFGNNGAIFGGGAIAVAFTAAASAPPQNFVVSYQPSNGSGTPIFPGPLTSSAFTEYKAAVDLDPSTNTDTGLAAFVDIIFALPASGIVDLTNIQITGQSTPLTNPLLTPPGFQQLTYERVVDHEFHVYKDSLVTQPKDNILVGWTFGLNPWQFSTTVSTNVPNTQFYTADQTILIQQNVVATNTGDNVAVGRGTAAQNYAYAVTAVTATNQFAIIQYIDTATIRPYWGQILSAMVNARCVTPTHNTAPTFKMRLIYRTTSIPAISQTEPIASWPALGEPVFAGGWTPILPLNDPAYVLGQTDDNYAFDQFQLPAATTDTMYLGIVIYTTTALNQAATADAILFNRVSLVPNDFAIDASTETYDETLRKCQFYYETSYVNGSDAATRPITDNGLRYSLNPLNANGASSGVRMVPATLELIYKNAKRSIPTPVFYSPTESNTPGRAFAFVSNAAAGSGYQASASVTFASFWDPFVLTTYSAVYFPNTISDFFGAAFTDLLQNQGGIFYQYIADARLGV